MSFVEGLEVIVRVLRSFVRPVISELTFNFLLCLASISRHHQLSLAAGPQLRRVRVRHDLSLLRGSACAKGRAVHQNQPKPNQLGRRKNVDHFVTWSEIRTEDRSSAETYCGLLRRSKLSLFVSFLLQLPCTIDLYYEI